jgi:hypothetical protein
VLRLAGRRAGLSAAAAALTTLLASAVLGVGSAHAAGSPACAALAGPDDRPPVIALDPRPHAPRIFAIQYRQAAANVVSYATFRTKIDCLLHRYVLPYRARHRPNVVVFNEDIGLATLGIGSRGAAARYLIAHPKAVSCPEAGEPCGAVAALGAATAAYAEPLAVYHARFPTLGGLDQAFVAGTDTIVRAFLGTFSSLSERYGLYMIGSGDLPPFVQSSNPADVSAFGDPDLKPRPPSVYVATAPYAYNTVFMWAPHAVRSSGPDVLRNVVAENEKVPLTPLEAELGFSPGPSSGPAAVANLRPYRLPGTQARIGFATSLPAFTYGSPPAGTDPCSNTAAYYMRCLDRLGANLVIQDEANPGQWTGPDGDGVEQWQPLSWMASTYRTVSDPSVHFDYNVTAMMVGNLADLPFDGQTAITQRGLHGRRCHYIGNRAFLPGEDERQFAPYAGARPDFLAIAPWKVPDASRSRLRAVGNALAPGSGKKLEDAYVETAIVADLPIPPDHARSGCVTRTVRAARERR